MTTNLIAKVHKKEDKTVVAVCDAELAGKKIEDGKFQLDLNSEFYKGTALPDKEIGDLIRNADCINLVGEKAVSLGLAEGVIEEKNIIRIKGIPHAQATLIHY